MPTPELHIVILAAGQGTRMRSALPKVLHQVAGKSLLAHVLDSVLELEPSKIHVVVGHNKQQVMDNFASYDINWVTQTEQLGTGHAVQQVMPSINDNASVLILTADVPLIDPATLAPMCSAINSFPLILLTALVPNPHGLGRIVRNEADNVCGIIEEKDASAEQRAIQEINSGILCARAAELKQWLMQISNDNAQQEYYLTDIVDIAFQLGNPISACQPSHVNEVQGINDRSQLAKVERLYQHNQAEQLMAQGVTIIDPNRIDIRGNVLVGADTVIDINCVIQGPTQIGGNVTIAPNCIISKSTIACNVTIHANTVIEESELGEGVSIGPFARCRPGTKLANNVCIGNFVETKNAQLGEGSKVNHLSYVGDTSVGKNTNIGAGVITANYDGANKHKTTIGDNVFVGSDSQLIAPVTIGDGATIGAGSTINSDVKKNQLAVSRARQRQIDAWQRPTKKLNTEIDK